MTSVHAINLALATIRGVPRATIDAYSRVLRREGVLPPTKRGVGATPLSPVHVGYILAAVMRGSPVAAAENAREIGDLIITEQVTFMAPILERRCAVLGWSTNITFAQAIGWLIDRYRDGTIGEYAAHPLGDGMIPSLTIEVNRYLPLAAMNWVPNKALDAAYVAACKEAIPIPPPEHRGRLRYVLPFEFDHPDWYEVKTSYASGDDARNSAALDSIRARAEQTRRLDRTATETVTERTLIALSGAFKRSGANRNG